MNEFSNSGVGGAGHWKTESVVARPLLQEVAIGTEMKQGRQLEVAG